MFRQHDIVILLTCYSNKPTCIFINFLHLVAHLFHCPNMITGHCNNCSYQCQYRIADGYRHMTSNITT